jgi:hypothetical protein
MVSHIACIIAGRQEHVYVSFPFGDQAMADGLADSLPAVVEWDVFIAIKMAERRARKKRRRGVKKESMRRNRNQIRRRRAPPFDKGDHGVDGRRRIRGFRR